MLLYILNLFPQLFDLRLDGDDQVGQVGLPDLRPHGVELPVELLQGILQGLGKGRIVHVGVGAQQLGDEPVGVHVVVVDVDVDARDAESAAV